MPAVRRIFYQLHYGVGCLIWSDEHGIERCPPAISVCNQQCSCSNPGVSSRQIASALGVTKPSVVHILNILMRDGMVVKRHYGKIYLTDRGAFTVNYYRRLLDATLAAMPEYPFPVSADERRNAALALIAALPDRDYREHFGALFAETEVEENEPQPESE